MFIFVFWGLLVIVITGVVTYYSDDNSRDYSHITVQQPSILDFSDFVNMIEMGSITQVRFRGGYIYGYYQNAQSPIVYTRIPKMSYKFLAYLMKKNVKVGVDSNASTIWFAGEALLQFLMLGLSLFVMYYFIRRRRDYGAGLNWIRSNTKTVIPPKLTFNDVAGVDEAKQSLQEVVSFLKEPEKFKRLGAKIPRGVLLNGPPGTGKTLLARCTAGESNSNFLYASGASFVNLYVGMGARNVRDLFQKARDSSPCVIFIDELDAIAGARHGGMTGTGSDEHAHALTELLAEMDGFNQQEGVVVVVIAATNRLDALDAAVLRPGRFDRKIYVGNPDINGRKDILKIYLKKIVVDPEINIDILAKKTYGFSGADLQHFVNEAALHATSNPDRKVVQMSDFDHAWLTIALGPKRNLCRTDEQRRLTAYHEAGHAIIGAVTNCDPIHTITIIPHGDAAGVVVSLPQEDSLQTKESLLSKAKMALGGRAAEEIVFGPDKVTTGASSDFTYVTNLVNGMVFQVGMGDDGDISSYQYSPHRFLNVSPNLMNQRHEIVKKIISDSYAAAKDILIKNRPLLDKIAELLLDRETLSGDEFKIIFDGGELPPIEIEVTSKEQKEDDMTESENKDSIIESNMKKDPKETESDDKDHTIESDVKKDPKG